MYNTILCFVQERGGLGSGGGAWLWRISGGYSQ